MCFYYGKRHFFDLDGIGTRTTHLVHGQSGGIKRLLGSVADDHLALENSDKVGRLRALRDADLWGAVLAVELDGQESRCSLLALFKIDEHFY